MSLEIILEVILSAVFISIYHADCDHQNSLAYACATGDSLIFGSRQDYYIRQVSPENYESSDVSHLIAEDDVWVTDPMDTLAEHVETLDVFVAEDLLLDELFAAADAIVPMEAEVAAELAIAASEIDELLAQREVEQQVAAIDRKINQVIHSSGYRVKSATVVQLRALVRKFYGESPKGNKAELVERVLNALANLGIDQYLLDGTTFMRSDDDLSVLFIVE